MKTTFIATGDAFMTRRLPENGYPGFQEVKELIGQHDVRFNNLEFTAHDKEGYPSAFSGGTWAMAEPEILDELNRYGFNLYNTANNHSLDYSHGGVLATAKHLRERRMLFAGTGENMAAAAAPVYLDTTNSRVAMIGVCSSFHDSDMAGNQSITLPGRPGLNGLRITTTYHVEKEYYDMLQKVATETTMNAAALRSIANGYANPLPEGKLNFGGLSFQLSDVNAKHTEPNKRDMERIIANIQEAKRQADYVLVSIHAHQDLRGNPAEPAEFLEIFAHQCIDAGADAILGHGPHELRGIEIYKGKAIFYSLGNFIFQTETVSLQPADAYENKKMPHDTMVGAYMNQRNANRTRGYIVQPNIWRSVMAGFTAENGEITEIKLYPVTMHMGERLSRLGCPCIAEDDAVLHYLAELSKPYGTELNIENNVATVKLK